METIMTEAKDNTCNGWKNRATWNVMLWMNNDESCYRAYRDKVERFRAAGKHFGGMAARSICRECLGETTPDGYKLSLRVDWAAIAEAMREE